MEIWGDACRWMDQKGKFKTMKNEKYIIDCQKDERCVIKCKLFDGSCQRPNIGIIPVREGEFVPKIGEKFLGVLSLSDYIEVAVKTGNGNQHFTTKTAMFVHEILNGCTKDYIFFDNAGGCIFDIWTNGIKEIIKDKAMHKHILAHRIDGITTIWNLHWSMRDYLYNLSWENWKTAFQKLMFEDDLKTDYIKLLSDDYWKGYFESMHNDGVSVKDAYERYLDEATETP